MAKRGYIALPYFLGDVIEPPTEPKCFPIACKFMLVAGALGERDVIVVVWDLDWTVKEEEENGNQE